MARRTVGRQTRDQAQPTVVTSKGEGPQWYGGPGGHDYDIRWLKSVKNEHPDGNLVEEYEAKYGEIT